MLKKKLHKMVNVNLVDKKKEVTHKVTSGGVILQEAKIRKLEVTYLH